LIKQGLRYVILSPEQAASFRPLHGETWTHLHGNGIDPTRPYLYVGRDGGSITIFFYDGLVARGIAFERALTSSQFLVAMFRSVAQFGPLVNVATDGETYGHHFKFGDLCLAHALEIEAKEAELEVTNYGQYLDGHPPEFEVEIKENSSWSCAHGIGRWSIDCGCAGEPGWNQRWRTPLRSALDFLRDEAARQFEVAAANLFTDPWEARNAYIQVVLDQGHSTATFLEQQVTRSLSPSEQARALTLLEIQRNSLLMFTSCGWFFSELSGIETLQIMRYAARVLELQRELGLPSPRAEFLDILAEAQSNIASQGNGADIFLNLVEHHPPNESLLTI
jgi:alpha-amylase/alpha-mannosidase (GH57 family)